jgi:hypothetical protein
VISSFGAPLALSVNRWRKWAGAEIDQYKSEAFAIDFGTRTEIAIGEI